MATELRVGAARANTRQGSEVFCCTWGSSLREAGPPLPSGVLRMAGPYRRGYSATLPLAPVPARVLPLSV